MQLLNVQLFFRIIDSFREDDNGIVCDGLWGFPCGSAGKESSCNVEDLGSVSGLGRSPGGGNGKPLQYCDLNIKKSHFSIRGCYFLEREVYAKKLTLHLLNIILNIIN